MPRTKALEIAATASFVVHGAALLATAACLLPALPGGLHADEMLRMAYVAAHPAMVRAAFVPWHAAAVVNLAFAIVVVRAKWIPRVATLPALALAALAFVFDMTSQFDFATAAVGEAIDCATAPACFYSVHEQMLVHWQAVAGLLYAIAGVVLSIALARTLPRDRRFGALSLATWPSFAIASLAPFFAASSERFTFLGNGLGLVLFEAWLAALVILLRGSRARFEVLKTHIPDES